MLYWIWFFILSMFAIFVAYFTVRYAIAELGSVVVQIFSLLITWDIHGGVLWNYLSSNIPMPEDGWFIHSLSVFAITAIPTLLWLFVPLLLWELFFRYAGIETSPGKYSGGTWIENSGVAPNAHRVNAEYADGNIRWNQKPSVLIWDTSIENPITQYMVKNKRSAKA